MTQVNKSRAFKKRTVRDLSHFTPKIWRFSKVGVTALAAAALIVSGAVQVNMTSAAPLSANLDQCRNGDADSPVNCTGSAWGNGNLGSSNSHYVEGQSAPYRVQIEGLTANVATTVRIGYDVKHSGAHAIDYLTSYDRIAESVDPTSGVSGITTSESTFAIPAPTTNSGGQPLASFNALPASEKLMSIWNGTISGIFYVNSPDLSASQDEQQVDITFTPTSTKVLLAWGGHIGSRLDWGNGNSAGGINGSPYHMRMKNFSGNQDRSMSADAISGILVIKNVVGGTATSSDFTISVTGNTPSPSSFPGNSSGTSVSLASGSYNVTEATVSNYTPTYSAECTGTIGTGETKVCTITNTFQAPPEPGTLIVIKHVINDNGGTSSAGNFTMNVTATNPSDASFPGVESPGTTITIDAGSYSVGETGPAGYAATYSADCSGTIAEGETKTCTITNNDVQPKLTVTKVVNGGSLQVSDFPLFVDQTVVVSGVQNGFNAGVHVVSETGDSNYIGVITGACSADGSVTLALGDVKSCTITNTVKQGGITIVKVTDPADTEQTFTFDVSWSTDNVTIVGSGQENFQLPAGDYDISEVSIPTNWTLDSSGCVDDQENQIDPSDITLDGDASIICTFENTFHDPNFDVSVDKTADDSTPDVGQTVVYTVVASNAGPATANDVELSDILPAGVTYVSDDGGDDTDFSGGTLSWSVGDLDSGESKTLHVTVTVDSETEGDQIINTACIPVDNNDVDEENNCDSATITVNTPEPRFSLSGTVYHDNNPQNSNLDEEDEDGLSGWTVYLDNDDNNELSEGDQSTESDADGNYEFTNLPAGCYTVREVLQSGWNQTEPTEVDDFEYLVSLGNQICSGGEIEVSFLDRIGSLFINTANAAVIPQGNTNLDFGNVQIPQGCTSNCGGGGGGGGSGGPAPTPPPPGRILGDFTGLPYQAPQGQVAGATTLPRTGSGTMELLALLGALLTPAVFAPKRKKLN